MSIDVDRVAFVLHPFRYTEAKDALIKARNPDAVIVRIDTNMNYAAAVVRATAELNANKDARVFDVEVQAMLYFDDFVGNPPAFALTSERHQVSNKTMRVVGFSADTNTGITTMRLRG